MTNQAFCTSCGSELKQGAEFCTNCGTLLKGSKQIRAAKKKTIFNRWWVWVIFAVVLISVLSKIGQAGNQDQVSAPDDSASSSVATAPPAKDSSVKVSDAVARPAQTTAPAPKAYKVGDIVPIGKFEVRVDGIQKTNVVGDQFLNKQAKGQFWVVKVDVLNNDTKARTVDETMFHLVDASGASYEADTSADMYANSTDNNFFLNDVNPHLTVSGYIVFDMPQDAKNITMKVDSGVMFAGGETVNINLGQ